MKQDKFYYYDEENDILQYAERGYALTEHYINSYLSLIYPSACPHLTHENIIGFKINGIKHMFHKAEEQASTPLTEKQEKQIEKIFKESGWKYSVNVDGEKIWSK